MSDCFCKIIGKVLHVGPVESVGAKGFKKRLLVVETQDKYPAILAVEWNRDRLDDPQGLTRGDVVTVEARVDGREYNGRYYVSLIGQRVEAVTDADRRPPDEEAEPTGQPSPSLSEGGNGEQEKLPF